MLRHQNQGVVMSVESEAGKVDEGAGQSLSFDPEAIRALGPEALGDLIDRLCSGSLRLEAPSVGPSLDDPDPTGLLSMALTRQQMARSSSPGSRAAHPAISALAESGWARLDGASGPESLAARCFIEALSGKKLNADLLTRLLAAGAEPHWPPGEHFFRLPIGRCLDRNWEEGVRALSARLRPEHFKMRANAGLGLLEALFSVKEPSLWKARSSWAVSVGRGWVAAGADVNERAFKERRPALLTLIQKQACLEALTAFLGLGPDVNVVDAKGETPLMICARTGRAAEVLALLDHGAETETANAQGDAALELARSARSDSPLMREALNRLSLSRKAIVQAREIEQAVEQEDARLGRALKAALRQGAVLELEGRSLSASELVDLMEQRPALRPRLGL